MALKIIPHLAIDACNKEHSSKGNVLPLSLKDMPLEAAHTNILQLTVMHSLRKD